jgi:hypothetical protein
MLNIVKPTIMKTNPRTNSLIQTALIFFLGLFTSTVSAQFEIESLYPDQVEMCVGQTFTITPDEVPLNPDSDANYLITNYLNYVGGPDISANDNNINNNANPTGVITLSNATMAERITMLKGSFAIRSKRAEGTSILVQIPL